MTMSKRTLVYTLDALMIGAIVGVIDTLFGRVLIGIGEVRTDYLLYLLPFLALAGILITYLNRTYGGKSQKGMELLFEVGEGREKDIPKRLIPLTILSTWMTHLFGGSAGREGVAVQLGGTVAHALRREELGPDASRIYFGYWDGSWLRWTLSDASSRHFLCYGGPSGWETGVAGSLSC